MKDIIKEYINRAPTITKENANHGFSISGLKNHISSNLLKEYTMSISPAADYHKKGCLHLHDSAGGPWSAYCRGLDLLQIMMEGIKNPIGTSSDPANHFDVMCDHIVNSLYISQNEWEGAQAFSNVDTLLAPFVANDGLIQKEVTQNMQRLIFNLSYPLRAAFQTPFTNLSWDLVCPNHMLNEPAIIGGLPTEDTYGDFQDEMDMINIGFLEVMMAGDKDGNPHTFPIPTYSITPDFRWDHPVTKKIFDLTAKFGTPYFMNYCLVRETPIIKIGDNGRIIRTNLLTIKPGQKIWTPEGFCTVVSRFDHIADSTINIKLKNGASVTCTPEHLFPTDHGLKKAGDICIDDCILISSDSYNGDGGTFDQGRFVGLYIAEGWMDDETQIYFSNRDKEIIEFFDDFTKNHLCANTNTTIRNNGLIDHLTNSKAAIGFIRDFVFGKNAYDKRLNRKVFGMSKDFREGLVHGWMEGDGCIEHSILGSSMSHDLLRDMRDVCNSIGVYTSLNLPTGNNQSVKKCGYLTLLSPSYDFTGNRNKGIVAPSNTLKEVNGEIYSRIDSIKTINKPKNVIDIQIDSRSKIFTLSNGILTHNCGSGLDPSSVRAMCCRLQMDLNEIIESSKGGLWNAGAGTGSLSVVTINMAQLGYLAKTRTGNNEEMINYFSNRLDTLLDVARGHNVWKREYINQGFEMGLMPFTRSYMPNFDSFFSTLGIVGMNECCLNMFGDPIYECVEFVEETLSYLNDYVKKLTKQYGYPWNLEEIPAEGCSHSLALKDKAKYPNIITQGSDDSVFYTNSSHIYVGDDIGLGETLRIQEKFKRHYNGGTLQHLFVGESAPTPEGAKDLIRNLCERTTIPYMALTRAYAVCNNCGVVSDLSGICPKCESETTVWDRVTGFYRPVNNYNPGKTAEFNARNRFGNDLKSLDLNW